MVLVVVVVATVVVRVDGRVGGAGGPVWYTSLPLAEKDLPFALAGEIPRELCQCVKLTWLDLSHNQLAGKFQQNSPSCFW